MEKGNIRGATGAYNERWARIVEGQARFQWKNLHFLLKNPDFLLENPSFLLKNPDFISKHVNFIIKQIAIYNSPVDMAQVRSRPPFPSRFPAVSQPF